MTHPAVSSAEQPTMPGLPKANPTTAVIPARLEQMKEAVTVTADPEVEKKLLMVLCDISLDIPSDSKVWLCFVVSGCLSYYH